MLQSSNPPAWALFWLLLYDRLVSYAHILLIMTSCYSGALEQETQPEPTAPRSCTSRVMEIMIPMAGTSYIVIAAGLTLTPGVLLKGVVCSQ